MKWVTTSWTDSNIFVHFDDTLFMGQIENYKKVYDKKSCDYKFFNKYPIPIELSSLINTCKYIN